MNGNRHGFLRNMIVRILFYGLFFVGPCALTESHSLYVRMRPKCAVAESATENEKANQECRRKIALLDAVGISAFGIWFAWLCLAVAGKMRRIVHAKRLIRKCGGGDEMV